MKVLIFGGAGFVGLNIAQALLERGHYVTLFDRAADSYPDVSDHRSPRLQKTRLAAGHASNLPYSNGRSHQP